MLVRILYSFVVRFSVFILFSVRIGITQMPEPCDELLAFFVSLQLHPGVPLLRRQDRVDVVYPLLESIPRFGFDFAWFALRIRARRNFLSQRGRNQDRERKKDR